MVWVVVRMSTIVLVLASRAADIEVGMDEDMGVAATFDQKLVGKLVGVDKPTDDMLIIAVDPELKKFEPTDDASA